MMKTTEFEVMVHYNNEKIVGAVFTSKVDAAQAVERVMSQFSNNKTVTIVCEEKRRDVFGCFLN